MLQLMLSTFSIVCVLVAFLRELRLGMVLTRQTWERILLIWLHLGLLGTAVSVDHPGVMMVVLFPSGDLSDGKAMIPFVCPHRVDCVPLTQQLLY